MVYLKNAKPDLRRIESDATRAVENHKQVGNETVDDAAPGEELD